MDESKLAEIAYEAYRANSGGVSLISGKQIPAFSQLSIEIKDAWAAAAIAIRDVIQAEK